jgi:hypothetical protein
MQAFQVLTHSRGAKRRPGGRATTIALLAAIGTLLAVSPALAAGKPGATTGGAKEVTFNAAALTGTVNPNGENTSYYFQYGLTKAYGGQSAIADAGSGGKGVGVKIAIGGLQPITVYHYRLVAVNAAGATLGADHTLLTTKVPLSLAIISTPNPVVFGGPVVVQGTLSGTNNANRQVILQANAFPFTVGFQNVGNPEQTLPTGSFAFTELGQAVTTRYRVVTTTNPPVISPETIENVAVRISAHIAHTKRHGFARFFGSVAPAADHMQVGILRIDHGRFRFVGGTVLTHHDAASSSFSRTVKVHRGVYRVLVVMNNGAQISHYSLPLLIR